MNDRACKAIILGLLAWVGSSISSAQTYPSKALRIVVPIAPGGSTDLVGRLVAQRFSEQMGVQAYVDNRPGAGATIGTELVAKSPPDGYTLLTIAVESPSIRACANCRTTRFATSPASGK